MTERRERRERRELKEERWLIEGLWVGFALLRDLDPARYKRADLGITPSQVVSVRHGGFRSRGSANPTSEPVITAPLFQFTAFSAFLPLLSPLPLASVHSVK
jgi:hypothetical protein